jgi:hypothetical protein
VSQVKASGVVLLLYKDARCDQNILDETVGAMNWQRHHSRDNANCIVSIWDEDKKQWIEKEDTGTESRTEREKGLASDSFKRACFNWGIGRELYTAPFIFIKAQDCNIQDGSKCYDNFTVDTIEYQPDGQREIRHLIIKNEKTGHICYHWQNGERKAAPDNEPEQIKIKTTPATVTADSPEQSAEKERQRLLKEYAMMAYGGEYKTKLNTIYAELKATSVTLEVYEQIKSRIAKDMATKKGAA